MAPPLWVRDRGGMLPWILKYAALLVPQQSTRLYCGKKKGGEGVTPDESRRGDGIKIQVSVLVAAKMWKKSKCPSTHEWIKIMWYMLTIDSAFKNKEIPPYAASEMNLWNIMLNEITQLQKEKYCMIPFT